VSGVGFMGGECRAVYFGCRGVEGVGIIDGGRRAV
jgi:hypothetical protein